MNEVKFVKTKTNAYVLGGVNTIIKVPTGQGPVLNQRAGIAYWMLRPIWAGPFLVGASAYVGSSTNPGYIANAFEDVMYPAPALGPPALGATIGYTLNGHEYFPSAAVSKIKPATLEGCEHPDRQARAVAERRLLRVRPLCQPALGRLLGRHGRR